MSRCSLKRFITMAAWLGSVIAFDVMRAQEDSALQVEIRAAASMARGKVSVACSLPGSTLNCDLDPHGHPPMQSVFKLPLAIAILHYVEQGKFKLDQPMRFLPEDVIPKLYSPLQDRYPNADVDVPLWELLQMSVALSDHAAADVLLRIGGGSEAVNDYIATLGVTGFHLRDGENGLHRNVTAQYRSWFEPSGAVELLRLLSDHSPLTGEHTKLLISWMRASVKTKRIKADLPEGTIVAHKAGTSDVNGGVAHATNDIGLIMPPDGRELAIAIFVTDSTAAEATRERVIALIAKAAYDASLFTSAIARIYQKSSEKALK